MTCPDHAATNYLCDPDIDPEIYALHISVDENRCASRLNCGCPCPNVCGLNEYCQTHFYKGDFRMARTHTNFSNTSQRLIIKTNPLLLKKPDFDINELFGMLPPEILMKIVRLIHFADLKQLYIMRIPDILALVQGDLVFNYTTLFANPPNTCIRVYKFESDYARGLRAIDIAIHQTRVSSSYNIAASCFSFERRDRSRTNDRRHYKIDCEAYSIDRREWLKKSAAEKEKYKNDLKFKPSHAFHPDISHRIGHRRMFPGTLTDHKTFQILNEFVYDDFFAKNKAETIRLSKVYQENAANYPLVSSSTIAPWS